MHVARPIRLLVVTGSLGGGGAERVTSTLLAHLDRRRVIPSVCLLRPPIEYPVPEDVTVTVLDKTRPWHLPRTVLRLRRLIREQQPDVVLSMIAFVNVVTGLALTGVPRVRWIARAGAPPATEPRLRAPLRYLYRRAAHVIANSDAIAAAMRAELPALASRVVVVPNPTDFAAIDRAAPPTSPAPTPQIVAVGRLAPEKRLDVLIDAFARLPRGSELALCGDGPLRATLERDVSARGLDAFVRFTGHLADPYPVVRRATIYALSSDSEGLPNALIEAQGLGVPAVATRCGGAESVVEDEVTGLLVPRRDPAALAAALERLLTDEPLRRRMAAAATRRARDCFDVAAVVPRYEELLAC